MREGNARFKDLADMSESDASMDLSSSLDGSDVENKYVTTVEIILSFEMLICILQ